MKEAPNTGGERSGRLQGETRWNRRRFLSRSLFGAVGLGAAGVIGPWGSHGIEPFRRSGPPRLLLSLAAYSFRDSLQAQAQDGERQFDLFEFIDFCATHGCQGTELTSYYFEDVSRPYLLALRRHAFLKGLPISGTAVGNDFTKADREERRREIESVKEWVDRAAILGAPHIRIFAGSASGLSRTEAQRRCVPAMEECAEHAARKGVMLGLENHGPNLRNAEDLLSMVRAVESRWIGVNLDTGNFHTADPYRDLEEAAPYAVNVQLKAAIERDGGEKEPTDWERVVRILRDAGYQGYVALEYEEDDDPGEAVPPLLGRLRELFRG